MRISGISTDFMDLAGKSGMMDRAGGLDGIAEIRDSGVMPASADLDVDIENLIKEGVRKIDEPQRVLDGKITDFLQGKEELHNVMLAAEHARFSMNFTAKVRDRIIEAYQTIMRMQV